MAQNVGADSDDPPAECFQFGLTVDVATALARIGPVLDAVVLDTDLPGLPTHVDAAEVVAVSVVYVDLCVFGRQAGLGEYQPRACLLRGLGTRVNEVERGETERVVDSPSKTRPYVQIRRV